MSTVAVSSPMPEARRTLLLLVAINLLCYLDRYLIPAVATPLEQTFFPGDPDAKGKIGLLFSAFLISYMVMAPLFGWLADRYSRWVIIGISVAFWSLASGASGFAGTFAALLITRMFLGIGEAGYGPAAPTLISDHYPVASRGRVMAWFFMAIPVGSALGYAFGGMINAWLGWRWAFYLMTIPGLVLAGLCFLRPEPRRHHENEPKPTLADYKKLLKIPSLISNILAQTALTFAIGGLGAWVPSYLEYRMYPGQVCPPDVAARLSTTFGALLAVSGLTATLLGGWLGDRLRSRVRGAYFLVSGIGMLLGLPATLAMLYTPFPYAWICIFFALFFLFLNIGPSNTAIANVTPPALRATAFAANIFVIHLLGDVSSPPLIGWLHDHYSWHVAFLTVSMVMLVAAVLWLVSMKQLAKDTEAIEGSPG